MKRLVLVLAMALMLMPANFTIAQDRRPGRELAGSSAGIRPKSKDKIRHGIMRIDMRRCPKGVERCDWVRPYRTVIKRNAYVNTGGALLLDLVAGAGGTAFNNANAYIGVGDSSTATTSGMTDLQAATNKVRIAMDATFPSRSGQVMTWRSTAGTSVANFSIQEMGLFNASSGGTMLSRIVQNLGTKASGTTWTFTYTITVP